MTDPSETPQPVPPNDPRVLALINQIVAAEAGLRELLGDNVDLVLDPTTGSPLFFHEIQQELLRTQEAFHQANEELARRIAELDATINSMADGLVISDPSGKIMLINPAIGKFMGFSPDDLEKPLAEQIALMHPEMPDGEPFPVEQLPMTRALRGERVFNIVMVLHPPALNTVWISSSAAPILTTDDGRVLGAVVSFTDITTVHALQEQQKALLQMVSHDLCVPLAVIKGYAQVVASLLEDKSIDSVLRQSIAAIDRSVDRMDVLIHDLVDVARWEGGQL